MRQEVRTVEITFVLQDFCVMIEVNKTVFVVINKPMFFADVLVKLDCRTV